MSTNSDLQTIFEQLAAGIELLGGNRFRATSHERVARLLRDMTKDIRAFVEEDPDTASKRLQDLPGVGKGAATRILEYLETGHVQEHQELLEQVPATVFDLLQIPGLGPKAVKTLWQELGVENTDDLRQAIDDGKVEALPRMGKKTVENMRRNLDFRSKQQDRVPIGRVAPVARRIVKRLRAIEGVDQVEFAGSLRRGRDTIGDLDFVASTTAPDAVSEAFRQMTEVDRVLVAGDTKSSVRLRLEGHEQGIQADLRVVEPAVFGAAMTYFTGSKEHNVRLREIAIRKGWRLNEYGLFEGTEERPQDQGQEPIASRDETSIYAKLDLPYIDPEVREDRGEIQDAPSGLVELGHIGAELHCHTTASDGKLELEELVAEAIERGFHTLAVTDHSQSSVLANGLDPERLQRHVEAIRRLDEQTDEIRILAGAEVDILVDGALDYEDEVLSLLDWVVASPHASLQQSGPEATERLLRALDNPWVDVLGHPTGRKVGRRAGLDFDLQKVFERAAKNDIALEVNANPTRLDLRAGHVRLAQELGCRIAINTDAHTSRHFDFLHYGVTTARRGWLRREQCINAWGTDELEAWRRRRRP